MASLASAMVCAVSCTPAPHMTATVPTPEPATSDEGRTVLSLSKSVPELPAGVFITNDTPL